jgi:hypothetical protein
VTGNPFQASFAVAFSFAVVSMVILYKEIEKKLTISGTYGFAALILTALFNYTLLFENTKEYQPKTIA